MLHFGCSNAESQCTESAVRAGVAVAAHNRHPRLRQPQLRPNHVHDPLIGRIHVEESDTEFFAVSLQGRNLLGRNQIGNGSSSRLGWNIVIDSGYGARGLAHFSSRDSQTIESLRRSHFMHQMKIDIQDRRPAARLRDQMRIPDLLAECSFCRHAIDCEPGPCGGAGISNRDS